MISFEQLTQNILAIDTSTRNYAMKAINHAITLRNWIIGGYIVEYEQHGNDRAKYGDKLIVRLSQSLNDKRFNATLLKNSRSFYSTYPAIGDYIRKSPTMSDFSTILLSAGQTKTTTVSAMAEIRPTLSDEFTTPTETLISKLSFPI